MTTTLDTDPLAPATVPADRSATLPLSDDQPSCLADRPFGLSLLTAVPVENLHRVPNVAFDRDRQVSVDPTGAPLVGSPLEMVSVSTSNTTYDMTTVTDREADD